LPALNRYVNVLRIELDSQADALCHLGGDQAGTAAEEPLINQPPRFVWFRIGRRIGSTGFCVGWSVCLIRSALMNAGDGNPRRSSSRRACRTTAHFLPDVPARLVLE
jgi:hypothetical protein